MKKYGCSSLGFKIPPSQRVAKVEVPYPVCVVTPGTCHLVSWQCLTSDLLEFMRSCCLFFTMSYVSHWSPAYQNLMWNTNCNLQISFHCCCSSVHPLGKSRPIVHCFILHRLTVYSYTVRRFSVRFPLQLNRYDHCNSNYKFTNCL